MLDLLLRRTTGRTFEEAATDALGHETTFGTPTGAAGGHMAMPGQDPVPAPATYSPAASAAGSQWWATADQLLDFAALNLRGGSGVFAAEDVLSVRTPTALLPGATVFDAWGMGWAVWDRGAHQAFGWAGYTGGHRAFLRCFPEQDAALVFLPRTVQAHCSVLPVAARSSTPSFRTCWTARGPRARPPEYGDSTAADELAGTFGPLTVEARGPD